MPIHKKVFTEKRRPYKNYVNAKWSWNDVFTDLNELTKNNVVDYFIKISVKYGILCKTLANKYRDFNNKKIVIDNKEHRGGCNKFFTKDNEQNLFNYFKNNFIDKNELLCDEIIKIKAISESKILYPTKKFVASSGWCYSFKNRWNLSTVSCSISRKATKEYTVEELNSFLTDCKKECDKVGEENFYNTDEMKCNNINVSNKTIHIKGKDNAKINVNGNEKEGVSTILTVSANGKILKPIIIAKGKTKTSLNKYNLTDDAMGCFSNNGWTNVGIMKLVIDSVSEHSNGKDACLLLDQYSSHCSEIIKIHALTKKVKLLYVPKGYTYKLQPLDVGINGIIKQKSKASWRAEKIKNPNLKITNADAMMHLMLTIKSLTEETIKKSFKKSCFMTKYE